MHTIFVLLFIPLIPADQWGASSGERAVAGWTQSPGGDRGLVLCCGLWHLSDGLHGRKDQTEHTAGSEVLTGLEVKGYWGESDFTCGHFIMWTIKKTSSSVRAFQSSRCWHSIYSQSSAQHKSDDIIPLQLYIFNNRSFVTVHLPAWGWDHVTSVTADITKCETVQLKNKIKSVHYCLTTIIQTTIVQVLL